MSLLQDLGYVYLAITPEGREYSFSNPFAAWTELETLGVSGQIEYVTADGTVQPLYARAADGTWTDLAPPDVEEELP